MNKQNLKVWYIKISLLNPAEYNPRKWHKKAVDDLKESIERFGLVDPIIVNSASNRKNVVIGRHFRLKVARNQNFSRVWTKGMFT